MSVSCQHRKSFNEARRLLKANILQKARVRELSARFMGFMEILIRINA